MKRKCFVFIGLIVFTLIFVMCHIVSVSNNLSRKIEKNFENHIAELANHNAASIKTQTMEQMYTLSVLAKHLGEIEFIRDDKSLALITDFVTANNSYANIGISSKDGKFYAVDGVDGVDVSQYEFFQRAMKGEESILGPMEFFQSPSKKAIICTVPIHKDGEIIGALTAFYDVNGSQPVNSNFLLEDKLYYYLANNKGEVIANLSNSDFLSGYSNVLTFLEEQNPDTKENLEIKKSLNQLESGIHEIKNGKREATYVSYTRVGIGDWYIFLFAKNNANLQFEDAIKQDVYGLVLIISFSILLLTGFIIVQQLRSRKESLLNEKCFHILAEQTGRIIFEYRFSTKEIQILNNFEEVYGKKMLSREMIHPDDVHKYETMIQNFSNGIEIAHVKFRVLDKKGDFIWCNFSSVLIKDSKDRPFKALGLLDNIDEQVREAEKLREKASTDSLTRLFNKTAAKKRIMEILKMSTAGDTHAMISADLDNFKNINDSFGHLFGDEVLIEVSKAIKSVFRSSDVLGRFGGDEFVLFIRNIPDIHSIQDKANELIKQIEKTYRVGDVEYDLSVSIGISLYDIHGTTYDTLYQKADEALYIAKKNGKNKCYVYGQDI